MTPVRKAAVVLGALASLLALVAVLWLPLAAPRLVKLPTDFTTTIEMSGTAEASAAPGTLAKLPSTVRLPVQATIDIAATSADEDVVVISMTETQKVGDPSGPTQDVTQKSQLVVDRSTEANVDDPRSWSVSPDHPAQRAGTYTVGLGFAFDETATYQFWEDSIAAGYPIAPGGDLGQVDVGGLSVTAMSGSVTNAPADPAWIASLTSLQPPTSLTAAQWTAAGFDIGANASADVDYLVSISSTMAIEDSSGGTAAVTAEDVTISFRPDPAATGGSPVDPLPVISTSLAETPQSVAADTAMIADNVGLLGIVWRWVPIGLAVGAALLAALTVVLARRARRAGHA